MSLKCCSDLSTRAEPSPAGWECPGSLMTIILVLVSPRAPRVSSDQQLSAALLGSRLCSARAGQCLVLAGLGFMAEPECG